MASQNITTLNGRQKTTVFFALLYILKMSNYTSFSYISHIVVHIAQFYVLWSEMSSLLVDEKFTARKGMKIFYVSQSFCVNIILYIKCITLTGMTFFWTFTVSQSDREILPFSE